jgi:thiol peroxidase
MAQITLGGNPTNTSGDLPKVGDQVSNFTLTKTDMSDSMLAEYEGKRIIFNIFPSVDTGVCAASIRRFNQEASNLDNTVVLCVSADLPFAQKRFCGAEGIENVVTLSSYRDGGSFGQSFGTHITDGKFAGLHARAVVIADESSKVIYTELVPEIGQEPNYEEALKAL